MNHPSPAIARQRRMPNCARARGPLTPRHGTTRSPPPLPRFGGGICGVGRFVALAEPAGDTRLPPAVTRTVSFIADVQPIFTAHCVDCHGPDKQKGGWRADDPKYALHAGDSFGPNILPGNSAASPLIQFVAHTHPELKMPEKGTRLTAEEVGILRAWIDQGANWPEGATVPAAKPVDPLDWWSLQALARPPVPENANASHPIDRFLQKSLADKGLRPAPEADRRTLLRRL
jgi:hypothetical protein